MRRKKRKKMEYCYGRDEKKKKKPLKAIKHIYKKK